MPVIAASLVLPEELYGAGNVFLFHVSTESSRTGA